MPRCVRTELAPNEVSQLFQFVLIIVQTGNKEGCHFNENAQRFHPFQGFHHVFSFSATLLPIEFVVERFQVHIGSVKKWMNHF